MEKPDSLPLESIFAQIQPSQKLSGSCGSLKEQAAHHKRSSSKNHSRQLGLAKTQNPPNFTPSPQRQDTLHRGSQVRSSDSLSGEQENNLTRQKSLPRLLMKIPAKDTLSRRRMSSHAGSKLVQDIPCRSTLAPKKGSRPSEGRQAADPGQENCDPEAASVDIEPSFDVTQMESEAEMRRNVQATMRKHLAKRARLRK